MDMFEGAQEFIAAHRPTIFGEFSPEWLKTRDPGKSAPRSWAATNQYVCLELVQKRCKFHLRRRYVYSHAVPASGPRSGTDLMLLPVETAAPGHA